MKHLRRRDSRCPQVCSEGNGFQAKILILEPLKRQAPPRLNECVDEERPAITSSLRERAVSVWHISIGQVFVGSRRGSERTELVVGGGAPPPGGAV